MTKQQNTKPLTEAQRNYLATLNTALLQAKQRMDEFIAYLRAEHDAPAPEWLLHNLETGFERRISIGADSDNA